MATVALEPRFYIPDCKGKAGENGTPGAYNQDATALGHCNSTTHMTILGFSKA
jgi:hypothetical protein